MGPLYAYQGLKDTTKDAEPIEDHLPASIHQGASNLHSDDDMEDKIKLLVPRVQKLIRTYLEVFPQHCSPCFLMATPRSTAKRLVVDYGELNKKTLNHSGSIPNMESTLKKIASCRYKTDMDKRSGFWQVALTPNAQELLAFITPQVRVFKWKVMPFGVANTPALFQDLKNKILCILRQRPVVQEPISRGAQLEAHIDDVSLGTNTQEDHLILLGEFFAVCQENHTRLKLEKCEFLQETMQYPGFDIGYGCWTPAASKAKPLMDAKVLHEDPKKVWGLGFDFAGTRRLSTPGGHLVGQGDILPTGS